jgi:pimeloyl-ACP methyl ester carboxylesterase
MSEQLRPNGSPVRVGSVTLSTPGLEGSATAYPPTASGLRGPAAELTSADLEDALESSNVSTLETVEIAGAREVPTGPIGSRGTVLGEPAMVVETPDPGEGWGQVVLYADEAGVVRWSFAREEDGSVDRVRGRATRTYLVPRQVHAAPSDVDSRGILAAAGRKLIKLLVFPIIDPFLGEVGDQFAARWENAKRRNLVRRFTTGDYQKRDVEQISGDDWRRLGEGRSLLFVHGTNSQAHTAFSSLPGSFLAWAEETYDHRVLAFDHFTLSDDPRRNVEHLLDAIPDDTELNVDIVCHSRGGLVSRVLAERQAEIRPGRTKVAVHKVVFVATPNGGTILADFGRLPDFLDAHTNLLSFFPDEEVSLALEGLITVVKVIALGVKGMEGLSSMAPNGAFLEWLNEGGEANARYFALAANFEPRNHPLSYFARDVLFDKIFGLDNDLIVPTAGVYNVEGCSLFPIEERYVFSGADGVHHSGFWAQPLALEKLKSWLSG